jgi:hypothetical protein
MASEFIADAREILDEIDAEVASLDSLGAHSVDSVQDRWGEAKQDIERTWVNVSGNVAELAESAGDDAEQLRSEVTSDIETLTRSVERAKLQAVDSGYDFIAAAEEKLAQIESDLDALSEEVDAAQRVAALRAEADNLRMRVAAMEQSSLEEVAEARAAVADAIAALSASIRREWLEARYDLTAD